MIDIREHGGPFGGGGLVVNGSKKIETVYEETINKGDVVTVSYNTTAHQNEFWTEDKNPIAFSNNGNKLVTVTNLLISLYEVTEEGYVFVETADTAIAEISETDIPFKLAVSDDGSVYGTSTRNLFRDGIKVPVDVHPSGNQGTISFNETGSLLFVPSEGGPYFSVYQWSGTEYKKVLITDIHPTGQCYSTAYKNGFLYVGTLTGGKLLVYKKEDDALIKQPNALLNPHRENYRKIVVGGNYLGLISGQSFTSRLSRLIGYELSDGQVVSVRDLASTENALIAIDMYDVVYARINSTGVTGINMDLSFQSANTLYTSTFGGTPRSIGIDLKKGQLIMGFGYGVKGAYFSILKLVKKANFSSIPTAVKGIAIANKNGVAGDFKDVTEILRR